MQEYPKYLASKQLNLFGDTPMAGKLGNKVIKLGDDDVKAGGRPVPGAGTHFVKFFKKDTKIKAARDGSDSSATLELHAVITKGKDKGKRIIDNIGDGEKSTWKVGQLCYALGLTKKQASGMTLVKLMKLCEKIGEWRINGRVQNSEEWGKQFKVTTHLPLKGGADAATMDDDDDEDEDDEEDDADADTDSDDEEDEDEDEDDEEDEEEDTDDDDDVDEDEEDEDEDEDEEDDEEDEDDDEVDEADDDEDDEEEEKPARRAPAKKSATKKPAKKGRK